MCSPQANCVGPGHPEPVGSIPLSSQLDFASRKRRNHCDPKHVPEGVEQGCVCGRQVVEAGHRQAARRNDDTSGCQESTRSSMPPRSTLSQLRRELQCARKRKDNCAYDMCNNGDGRIEESAIAFSDLRAGRQLPDARRPGDGGDHAQCNQPNRRAPPLPPR